MRDGEHLRVVENHFSPWERIKMWAGKIGTENTLGGYIEPPQTTMDRGKTRVAFAGGVIGAIAASVGLSFGVGMGIEQQDRAHDPAGPQVVPGDCELSASMQTFTFEQGQGPNHAVHAIEGSGPGEGAQCFDEAQVAVDRAIAGLDENLALAGATIQIPASVSPR